MRTATFTILIVVVGLARFEKIDGSHESEMKDMVYVPEGTFNMGDVFHEDVPLASPVQEVTLSGFYLNKYEVTVGEFSLFVDENEYITSAEAGDKGLAEERERPLPPGIQDSRARLSGPGAWKIDSPSQWSWNEEVNWRDPGFEQDSRSPVVCISWKDAIAYCNWLSQREGLPIAYEAGTGRLLDEKGRTTLDTTQVAGYRLSTEAEWEFAARERGKKLRFGNGSNVASSADINFNAAHAELPYAEAGEFRKRTVPVGSFRPNILGLYDMSGNVWEWCSDFVGKYSKSAQKNPYQTEGVMGPRRAARGGPWAGDAGLARTYVRLGWTSENRCNNIGFRIARSAAPSINSIMIFQTPPKPSCSGTYKLKGHTYGMF